MRTVLAPMVLLVGMMLAACATETAGEDATGRLPSAASGALPRAVLTAGLAEAQGEPGTRCWDRMCIDLAGPVTPMMTTPVSPGATVDVEFDRGAPDEVRYEWMRATDPAPRPKNGVRSWSGLFPPVMAPVATGLAAPVVEGDYVLLASAVWQDEGDISYGFYLRVRVLDR